MAKPDLMGLNGLASSEFSQDRFLQNYTQDYSEDPWVTEAAGMPEESPGAFFDYGWVNSSFKMTKRTDGWQLRQVTSGTARLEMFEYRDGMELNDNHLRRDRFKLIKGQIAKFAQESKAGNWEDMCLDLFEAGESLTTPVDGKAFFASDHILNGKTAQRNIFTKVQVPGLQVVSTTAITALELARAFRGVIAGLRKIVDKNDRQVNKSAKVFRVVISEDLADLASEAVSSTSKTLLGTGGVNVDNPLQRGISAGREIRVSGTAALTGLYFYVFVVDQPSKPLMRVYENLPAGGEYQTTTEDGVRFTHHDFSVPSVQESGMHKLLIEANRNAGLGDWYVAAKATLST